MTHMLTSKRLPLAFYALPLVAAFMLPNFVTPLMELWRSKIGFSSGVLTLIFVAYITGLAPAFLLAPALATQFGRRRVMVAALLLGIGSCVFYVTAKSVVVLLVARLLTGLCSGIMLVLGTVAVKEEAKESELRYATLLATTGVAIGLAGGPLVAGAAAWGLPAPTQTVFVLEAVLLALCVLIVLTQQETAVGRPESWLPFRAINFTTKKTVLAGLGAFGPGMTAAAIVLALAPTILHGMGGVQGPLAAGVLAGGMYAVSPIAQALLRGKPSPTLIRLSILGIAISMIVMSVALVFNNIIVLALAAALIGAGQGVSNLGSFGLIHERVDNSEVAAATSLLSLGTYASATVVPILGGVLLDFSGLEVAGLVMAAGVLVMCGVGIAVGSGPEIAETEG